MEKTLRTNPYGERNASRLGRGSLQSKISTDSMDISEVGMNLQRCREGTKPLSFSRRADIGCKWLSSVKAIPSHPTRGLAANSCQLVAVPPARGMSPPGLNKGYGQSITQPLQSDDSSLPL